MSLFARDKVKILSKSIGDPLRSIEYNADAEYVICRVQLKLNGEHQYVIIFNGCSKFFLERDLKLVSREIPIETKVRIPYTKKGRNIDFENINENWHVSNILRRALHRDNINYMLYTGFSQEEHILTSIIDFGGDFFDLHEIVPYDEPFRIGDVCILAPYLQNGINYGNIMFLNEMERYKTEKFRITGATTTGYYNINAGAFIFSHEMLIKVGQTTLEEHPVNMTASNIETETQEERRETQMKWRTVEGELEVGNRIKCTWEWYNEYDGEVHGIEFCTRTHELRTPRPGVRHTTKMVKIPGTRNELANKEVIIYKDTDGWLIIKTVGQHRMLRGTTPRTFYQAICPEHIAAYESEQRTLEELNPEPQVPPQTQANNNPPAPGTSAWGTISSNRQREEQARAEREREAQQRLEEAERETQRERERERIRAGEHELLRQREAREAKFNIWVHHEKNEIL